MIKQLKPFIRALPASTVQVLDAAYARARGRLVPRQCRDLVTTEPPGGPPAQLLIATGSGLLHAREGEWHRIFNGFFYGLTEYEGRWWAFRRISEWSGQLVSFELADGHAKNVRCECTGLDPEVHQIDFIGPELFLTDTALNRLLVFDTSGARTKLIRMVYPAGRTRRNSGSSEYVHLNSVFRAGKRIYLVFHNQSRKTGKPSEVAILDGHLQLVERFDLRARCAHNVAVWRDRLVVCDSLGGAVQIGEQSLQVGAFTRGLSIVDDYAFVGGSNFAGRTHRREGDGNLYQVDLRTSTLQSRWILKNVGSVYEVRAVAANDLGLSNNQPPTAVKGLTVDEHNQAAMVIR